MTAKLSLVRPVPLPVNVETVKELELLLADAKKGKINGFAYVAMEPGKYFSLNATGSARYVPAYSLGALEGLRSLLLSLMS